MHLRIAQEARRLARTLHGSDSSTAAFWAARQHAFDAAAALSEAATAAVIPCSS